MEYIEVITDATTGEQTIRPYTEEEIAEAKAATLAAAIKSVREERNRLLTETDWTMLADAPVDQDAWSAYRQALRDIPEQPGFPFDTVWPVKPN